MYDVENAYKCEKYLLYYLDVTNLYLGSIPLRYVYKDISNKNYTR